MIKNLTVAWTLAKMAIVRYLLGEEANQEKKIVNGF